MLAVIAYALILAGAAAAVLIFGSTRCCPGGHRSEAVLALSMLTFLRIETPASAAPFGT